MRWRHGTSGVSPTLWIGSMETSPLRMTGSLHAPPLTPRVRAWAISHQNFELNTCFFFLFLLYVFKGWVLCNWHVPLMRAAAFLFAIEYHIALQNLTLASTPRFCLGLWILLLMYIHSQTYGGMLKLMSIFPPVSSVLKTFIHDPLVEWEKSKGRSSSAESSNEKVRMFMCGTSWLIAW